MQYYCQVIPTIFSTYRQKKYQKPIETNQFSVTTHLRSVGPNSGRGMPGVFFFYEVSPLKVNIVESRGGWMKVITSFAGVLGGVVAFMGVVDGFFYDKVSSKGGIKSYS